MQNARTHSKRQLRQIGASIRRFGFVSPVLVDVNNRIIVGHGRVEAAKQEGMTQVPVIRIEDLSEDEIRAYAIADNKLAENAGWDREMLAIEFQHLLNLDSLDLDVTITGFEMPEIDLILNEASENRALAKDAVPAVAAGSSPITNNGDKWFLGPHVVTCGDCIFEESYQALMGNELASIVFVDPPYNVRIDGHATGNGHIHHKEFAMASGEMSEEQYLSFLSKTFGLIAKHSSDGSIHFACMDWRHAGDLISVAKETYGRFLNMCVWVKDSGGMGSLYRSQHELVLVFQKGNGPYHNNVQLGRFGRNRTNVWRYPGVNTFSRRSSEGNLLALHPTVKPVEMVADALLDCSARGEIVLDSFLGSGTTLLAAERVGRICRGMEIDPQYVDVAIRRWQTYTGQKAIHATTGNTFDETATLKEANHG